MGNSLREVQGRIESTKKTSQITKAMYMVSSAKVRKSEKTFLQYQDYMVRFSNMVKTIASKVSSTDYQHDMLTSRPIKKTAYVLVTSDTGLAGAYNSGVFKSFEKTIEENHKSKEEFYVSAIGKKGHGLIKSKGYPTLHEESIFVRDDVLFVDIEPLVNTIVESYISNKVDKIVIIYNHYINSITQEVTLKTVLPINEIEGEVSDVNYVFEGGIESTLDSILPMYVQNTIYGIILDAKTSEHSSRMTSMKNATDNAKEVIEKLQLLYNRARQAAITNELIDIIGGASAIE
ncbi:MAG: ATP synthase F1 subunit gamma [bacterium]